MHECDWCGDVTDDGLCRCFVILDDWDLTEYDIYEGADD